MIRVIVKGTTGDALDATLLRGIPLQGAYTLPNGRETIGEIPIGYLSSVIAWNDEDPKMIWGEGYPIGTLLTYSVPEWIAGEGII